MLALAEELIDVRRPHPDEIPCQPAVRVDPRLDVSGVGGPERCGGLRQVGEMEAETGLLRDADAISRDVAQQHGAGRLARADDAHARALRPVPGPFGVVVGDAPAVIVVHVDRFRPRGQRREKNVYEQEQAAFHD
jgi:hypothetical protein